MADNEALRQLRRSGYAVYLQHLVCGVSANGTPFVNGTVKPELRDALIQRLCLDDHGATDIWHHLHADVGKDRYGWRSWANVYGSGCLQIVIGCDTCRVYADVDRFNTQDLVNIGGHLGAEVAWPKLKAFSKTVSKPFRKLRTLVRWLRTPEDERIS